MDLKRYRMAVFVVVVGFTVSAVLMVGLTLAVTR